MKTNKNANNYILINANHHVFPANYHLFHAYLLLINYLLINYLLINYKLINYLLINYLLINYKLINLLLINYLLINYLLINYLLINCLLINNLLINYPLINYLLINYLLINNLLITTEGHKKMCHDTCIGGCWGEGPSNCVQCSKMSFRGHCVASCAAAMVSTPLHPHSLGIYTLSSVPFETRLLHISIIILKYGTF